MDALLSIRLLSPTLPQSCTVTLNLTRLKARLLQCVQAPLALSAQVPWLCGAFLPVCELSKARSTTSQPGDQSALPLVATLVSWHALRA